MLLETLSFPSTVSSIIWTVSLVLLLPIAKLLSIIVKPYFSNLRELPGPPGGSWITGHIPELNKSETDRAECHLRWLEEYGHVFVYKSLLNVRIFVTKYTNTNQYSQSDRLTTTDPKALNHILANPMIYFKPAHLRLTLGQLIGEGMFSSSSRHQYLIYDHRSHLR